jgi:hypothetical protein
MGGVAETRNRKNAFFGLAGVARSRCVFTLAQAGMPVLPRSKNAAGSGFCTAGLWPAFLKLVLDFGLAATKPKFKGAGETPAVREALLQLLEDAVEGDGIGGDGAGVCACGELGESAGGCALLENFHLVGIHCGAGHEDVIVAGEVVHPGSAVDGRLRRSDERRLREIERVAAGGVVAGAAMVPETWMRLPSSQVSMSENVSAMVAPLFW